MTIDAALSEHHHDVDDDVDDDVHDQHHDDGHADGHVDGHVDGGIGGHVDGHVDGSNGVMMGSFRWSCGLKTFDSQMVSALIWDSIGGIRGV